MKTIALGSVAFLLGFVVAFVARWKNLMDFPDSPQSALIFYGSIIAFLYCGIFASRVMKWISPADGLGCAGAFALGAAFGLYSFSGLP